MMNSEAGGSQPKEYEYTPEAFAGYINMEIGLPRGDNGELCHAVVKKRAVDMDGRSICVATNNNPLTNSRPSYQKHLPLL